MDKRIFGVVFVLVGVLTLVGAGCSTTIPADTQEPININLPLDDSNVIPDTVATESPDKFYNSIEEITVSAGLASELKSIFGEACNGVKLTAYDQDFPVEGADMLVYVWKNKPAESELISAFEKSGYKIEESGGGGMILVKKGNVSLTVDWDSPDRADGHEIVVLVT